MLRMLTSSSLSAFSVMPQAGAAPVQRTRAPGSSREDQVPPTPPAAPNGSAAPVAPQPGSRVLPRGSLVDLSV